MELTGSPVASDALRALSSSLDVRRYGPLGSIAVPSFRGLPPEYTIVYRDGIRLTNEQIGETDVGQLALNGISEVELIPASSAVLLGGDAAGTAINFVSRFNDTTVLRLATEQTAYSHASVFEPSDYMFDISEQPFSGLSLVAGGSLEEGNGRFPFLDTSTNQYLLRQNNDVLLRNAYLNGAWVIDTSLLARITSNYFYADRGVASTIDARQTDEQSLVALRLEKSWDKMSGAATVSYQSQDEIYRDPSIPVADSGLARMFSLHLRTIVPIASGTSLYAGSDVIHTELTGNTNALASNISIVDRNQVAGYSAIKLEPVSHWTAAAALRLEGFSDLAGPQLLPQFTLEYEPIEEFYASAAFSRSFHAPTLNDLYWKGAGNPNLHPEHISTAQLQVEYRPLFERSHIELGATAFYSSISDEILWTPVSATLYRPFNIDRVRTSGIEFHGALRTKVSESVQIDLEGSYTLLDARDITPSTADSGHELPYSSPTRSLFIASVEFQDLGSLSLVARYRGHEFSTLDNDIENYYYYLQPATTYDLTIASREFPLGQISARCALTILNLSDLQYQEVLGYPLPGRTFTFSIQCNYH